MAARETLLLVDGNSLAHRAFHALPPLTNRQGVQTNAVYGFTTMLLKALQEARPAFAAVAFDKSRVTFRHQQFEAYKGHRAATPEELRPQLSLIRQVVEALGLRVEEREGFEADDLLGSLRLVGEKHGLDCVIVTGDRDCLQLVSPRTTVWLTRKGLSELQVMDEAAVRQAYGLRPAQLIDVKALMGDASDNIPGVPGIGEKTALKLIQQYGDLEGVLAHREELPARQRDLLGQYAEQAMLSRELATICCDVPLEGDVEFYRRRPPEYERLLELFQELEFRSLIPGVLAEMKERGPAAAPAAPAACEILRDEHSLAACRQAVLEAPRAAAWVAFTGGDALRGEAAALGLAVPGRAWGWRAARDRPAAEVLAALLPVWEGRGLCWHDAKPARLVLRRQGVEVGEPAEDTMLAGYLLNPTAGGRPLAELCLEHLNRALVEVEDPAEDAARKAAAVLDLAEALAPKLRLAGMETLYREVELPLIKVLADMEWTGVLLDVEQLAAMGRELNAGLERLSAEIYDLAGGEFNINSPRQLGEVLFERLGLPRGKKTKTGYSTNAEVLEELAPLHPLAARVLEYRTLMKLHSTYVEGLRALVRPETGRVHTTFNQMVTATGRLSSSDPNLQNIPIRLELGRRLRKVFLPGGEGRVILAADYSQIELRVLAHISGDEGLRRAFLENRDIHTSTAAEVFGVAPEEVTPELRRRAKAVNFGIVYGISDFGLARDLGISRQEARAYIDLYFRRYPGVKRYMEETVARAREQGYVSTLLGRRRYLPDLFSANRTVRSFGERTAINTPIQGSAADIMKLAMLRVAAGLADEGCRGELLLQVHDELILAVPREELDATARLVRRAMEEAMLLAVPLRVDVSYGANWYDLVPWREGEALA